MKKKILLALVAMSMLAAAGLFSLGALPSHEIETTYYTDASKTHTIGGSTLTCNSGYHSWGQTSPYSDTIYRECTTGLDDACTIYIDGIPVFVPCD